MNNTKRYSTIAIVALICILVMGIGGLAGWLLVARINGKNISWQDAARGFGVGAPSAGQNGSTYSNVGGGGSFSAGGGSGIGGIGSTGAGDNPVGSIIGYDTAGNPVYGNSGAGADASSTLEITASSSTSSSVVPKTPRLWHATKTPVAGFMFATNTPTVFFSERATGYILTADVISGDILRRTNTLLPKTYEAFLSRGGAAIYRSVNDTTGAVQTFSGIVGSSTSPNIGTLTGVNLPNNILAMDANPDAKNIFFIVENDGVFTGVTEPWTPGKSGSQKEIFTSSIASWRPYALSDGRFVIAEKPEDDALGYAYEIAADKSLKPLVRAAPGLTILPLAKSSAFIFGTSANGSLSLFAQTSEGTLALPVKTVADKCVWAPYTSGKDMVVYCAVPSDANVKKFLQNWYMGALHTSDSWWRLNLTTSENAQILEAAPGGSALDVIDPSIDPTGNFLAFRNNADGTLWVLRIKK